MLVRTGKKRIQQLAGRVEASGPMSEEEKALASLPTHPALSINASVLTDHPF